MIKKLVVVVAILAFSSCKDSVGVEVDKSKHERDIKNKLNYKVVDGGYVIYLDGGGMVLISTISEDNYVAYDLNDRNYLIRPDGRYIFMDLSNDKEAMILYNNDLDVVPDRLKVNDVDYNIRKEEMKGSVGNDK